ncbi:MAG: hypothetical protein ACP5N0_01055 [Methanosarcina sp.]|jgi:hypothetical protein
MDKDNEFVTGLSVEEKGINKKQVFPAVIGSMTFSLLKGYVP